MLPGRRTMGNLAAHTGRAVCAIRFCETNAILTPDRNAGGHRHDARADLPRLSFAMIAQRPGLPTASRLCLACGTAASAVADCHWTAAPSGTKTLAQMSPGPTRATFCRRAMYFKPFHSVNKIRDNV